MYQNEYVISTDLKRKMTSIVPHFVQYDKAVLIFKIYDNGLPFPVEEVTEIEVTNVRPDGKAIVGFGSPMQLDDGTWAIRYSYLGSEMRVKGTNKVGVSMFKGEDKVSILPFNVEIVADPREIAGGEQAEDDAGLLTQLIESVKEVLEEATEVIKDANKAIHEVQQEIENATELGEHLTEEIDKSQKQTVLAKDATNKANIATQGANSAASNATTQANHAKSQGDYAKAEGDKAKTATNNANTQAAHAKTQGDYAKNQGDYAKTEGAKATTAANNANSKITEMTKLQTDVQKLKGETESVKNEASTQADRAKESADLAEPLVTKMQQYMGNVEGLENKGSYSSTVTYNKNNIVSHEGSSYMSLIDDNLNKPITDTTGWELIARKGLDGKGSVVTVNQKTPDTNGNVHLIPSDIDAVPTTHLTDIEPHTYGNYTIRFNSAKNSLDFVKVK